MGDAGYNCFSSLCMKECFGERFFKCLEYGTSLPYVVNLVGTQHPYFWRYWETCRSLEVYASWNFVWMVSYLGVHAVYFYFWIFLCLLVPLWFVTSAVESPSWTHWFFFSSLINFFFFFYKNKLLLSIKK